MTETKKRRKLLSRRNIIVGGVIAAGALVIKKKPTDLSGTSDDDAYFKQLSAALLTAGIGKPTLIIDKERLHKNIDMVTQSLPAGMALRVAQKSVPSMGLLNEILSRSGTNRLMVFNKDYLQTMCLEADTKHILMGKPMPILAAQNFYKFIADKPVNEKSVADLEWLIDTPERLAEYAGLAATNDNDMNINIELNVGLNRGGVNDPEILKALLTTIKADPNLTFKGFMGYEKQIVYAPGGKKGMDKYKEECWAIYRNAVDIAKEVMGADFNPETATLNGGGSATYRLYEDTKTMNDLCLGSAFVMPSHFDYETLAGHVPASFIAAPVLKQADKLTTPLPEFLNKIRAMWNPNERQSFFHYGGRWLADPVYPKGLTYSPVFGRSSNQEFVTGSDKIELDPNDYIILRPQESEAVFLQFGDIAVYENGKITEFWPVLPAAP